MGQTIHIAVATIHGVDDAIEYIKEKDFYSWSLTFTNTTASFFNLAHIYLGKEYDVAECIKADFKERFTRAKIFDGNRVAVIFDDSGNILAIGAINSQLWIDTNNKFTTKRFKDLNLNLDSLIYHG